MPPLTSARTSGQWVGWTYPDAPDSKRTFFMANIEARSPESALLVGVEPDHGLRTISFGSIEQKGGGFSGKTWNYQIYDQRNDRLVSFPDWYKEQGSSATPPSESDYTATFDGQRIQGSFKNNSGETGRFELWKSFSEATSGKPTPPPKAADPMSWGEFKTAIAKYRSRGQTIFRGQHSNAFPLKTLFHRKGRNNLFRYSAEDLARLRHQINAISSYCYRPSMDDDLALLSLSQHHGFPTPLLDWTESPYVAAFFAFDCLSDKSCWCTSESSSPVRIFAFDRARWNSIRRVQAQSLRDPFPDLQFFHPPAYNNPRYYPQQSVAAFSNVEDIEGLVSALEVEHRCEFLTRFDILPTERELVEDELRFMGITAATLFPGIEGACKSLATELF